MIYDTYHVKDKNEKNYFCLANRNNPISVIDPPITVNISIPSWKRNQAIIDANIGSPIGVDATIVGETYRMA